MYRKYCDAFRTTCKNVVIIRVVCDFDYSKTAVRCEVLAKHIQGLVRPIIKTSKTIQKNTLNRLHAIQT